jgi:competence protein ComEC
LFITYLLIAGFAWRSPLHTWFQQGLYWMRSNWQDRVFGPSTAGVLGVGCILIWLGVSSQPDGRLHLYFLDIGQGDGILIQTPSGRQVLIDGGASPESLFNELGQVMPFWDRSLDIIAMTNPDILWPPSEPFVAANERDEQFVDNENSLVMKLTYGDFTVLLTGDAGLPAEMAMLAADAPVQATVLKVGHHGSNGSTSATFLEAVNPQIAVIQAGVDNDYGHPHQEVLDRLGRRTILRNDLHGRIHLYSDGRQLWLETEKNSPLQKEGSQ